MSELKGYTSFTPFSVNPVENTEDSNTLAMYHGKATDTLATMSSRAGELDNITGDMTITSGGVKAVIHSFKDLGGTLGINTHKLLMVAIAKFTALNNYDRKGNSSLKYKVEIPLKKYSFSLGYDVMEHDKATPEEAKIEKKRASNAQKDARKKIKKDLDVLEKTTISFKERVKGKEQDYLDVKIIGTKGIVNGNIIITFDPFMAEYLAKLPQTQYPIALLGIDARNSTAYILGLQMAEHFYNDNNQIKGTATRLKVETLLTKTDLPKYEDIRSKYSWEERIKEPFQKALDNLVNSGVIDSWEYVGSKGRILDDSEACPFTYIEWKNLYVEYTLSEPTDQTERIKRGQERKRKAQEAKRKKSKK